MQAVEIIEPDSSEVMKDLATKQFVEATVEIMAMPPDEFEKRWQEFGYALTAINARAAQVWGEVRR